MAYLILKLDDIIIFLTYTGIATTIISICALFFSLCVNHLNERQEFKIKYPVIFAVVGVVLFFIATMLPTTNQLSIILR